LTLLRGLLLSCHPLPCLAVTAFAAAYAVTFSQAATGSVDVGRGLAVALAILSGQVCVGWSNDAIDADRDLIAARAEKPVAAGLVTVPTLWIATAVAGSACVVLSLRLGAASGLLHLLALAAAISYNTVLKGTWLSPLPYVVSFGLLPMIVSLAGPEGVRAPLAHVIAAALLGTAAHFGNTVGDSEADAVTGVRGLPQRVGPERSLVVMALLVGAASVVLLIAVLDAGEGGRRWVAGSLLLTGVLLAALGARRRIGVPGGRSAWRLTLAAVAVVVAGFLVGI
jgi:4-hydroxybenzoate polyprenyltransferase